MKQNEAISLYEASSALSAMKQALEALEIVVVDVKTTPTAYEAHRQAITALRAAIASYSTAIEQAAVPEAHKKQEPVAWIYPDDLERFETSETFAQVYSIKVASPTHGETVPLYTTPPAAPVQDEFLLRGILASELKCWHRLTEDEETNLLAFVKNMAPKPAPVQEPVAWMGTDIEGNPNKFRLNPFGGGVALYKKPQFVKVWDAEGYDSLMQQMEMVKAENLRLKSAAQRQWVGLTDEELNRVYETHHDKFGQPINASQNGWAYERAIEAKLREKNGGQA